MRLSSVTQQSNQSQFLDSLWAALPDLYLLLDQDGTIRDCHGPETMYLGRTPAQLLNRSVNALLPDPVTGQFRRAMDRSIRNNTLVTFEYNVPCGEGKTYYEARITPIPENRQLVCLVRDITELHEARERLESIAHCDPLTGLANRSLLDSLLERNIKTARRNHSRLAVMFIDLDRFKEINDTLGHAAGDDLLTQTATRLQNCLRESDVLARVGGDEFVALLDQIEVIDDASAVACKLMDAINQPFILGGVQVKLSCSIGISLYPDDARETSRLLDYADIAMYRAKESGRSDWRFYTADMTTAATEHRVLLEAFKQSFDNNSLTQVYQPQIDFSTGRIIGFEALARWHMPGRGPVQPREFISLAGQAGLMRRLDTWSVRTACAQLRNWQDTGGTSHRVSINLSCATLQQADFVQALASALDEYQLAAHQLEIEIRELTLLGQHPVARDNLRAVSELGIGIAIDDFGVGDTSLDYLRTLPITTLKLAASFMHNIPHDKEQAIIARTIIAMGRALGLKVVVKGIENESQANFIKQLGGVAGQGFYFSQPLPAEEIPGMTSRH
ncbi:hypothetical protein CWI75_13005 [Kineobactrum sediminis]|uniref:Diguanylate cyclase n=1 Tax=Kineobactrum sediminis TaxID=1905677 RepID=A0A2N5Y0U0_9GAMM|nr:EAL domain-containing protein [Kineobactrum sediminis]PLW82001.1 hypothetical protein CWI75_13005 [Kineobactrum sediminis]